MQFKGTSAEPPRLPVLMSESSAKAARASTKPDFAIVDTSASKEAIDCSKVLGHQISSFIEVKARSAEKLTSKISLLSNIIGSGTNAATDDSTQAQTSLVAPTKVLVQITDYGHDILYDRPFHLFSIGAIIYGKHLCMAYFDHLGVILSPEYNYIVNPHILIQMIIRLCCDLGAEDLGHDPAINFSSPDGYSSDVEPRYRITPRERHDDRGMALEAETFVTSNSLFVSRSILGRSTSVFSTSKVNDASVVPYILKSAWRDPESTVEKDVYKMLRDLPTPRSIASCHIIEDAQITCHGLREQMKLPKGSGRDRVLSRVYITPMGRRLSQYKTLKGFAKGLIAIVEG